LNPIPASQFSDPLSFVGLLWDHHPHVLNDPASYLEHWERDVAMAEAVHADIFNLDATPQVALVVGAFLGAVSEGKHPHPAHNRHIPREWLHLFHQLYEQGSINGAVWGIAARFTYMASAPIRGVDYATTLPALRSAPRQHFMLSNEYAAWETLPETIRAYRGLCASDLTDAHKGISWTPDPFYATLFARRRTVGLWDIGERDGWPRLLEVSFPKSALLAVWSVPDADTGKPQFEMIIDFEMLTPTAVTEVKPLSLPQVAAAKISIAEQVTATASARKPLGFFGHIGI